MFDTVKNIIINKYLQEINQINQELSLLKSKNVYDEDELIGIQTSIDELNKLGFIKKNIFNREYKSRKKDLFNKQDELYKKYSKERNERISELEDKLYLFTTKLEKASTATNIKDLGFESENEFLSFIYTNNIVLSVNERLEYIPNISCSNIEFMKKAINEDIKNYAFDTTNDLSLFKLFLERYPLNMIDSVTSDIVKKNLAILYSDLNNPEFLADNVNQKLVFYLMDYVKKHLEIDSSIFIDFENLKKLYLSNAGRELEMLYQRDDIVVGMHATNYNNLDNEIFKKGLKNSTQDENAIRSLYRTVAYSIPFVDILTYDGSAYAGAKVLRYNYIVLVPKGVIDGDDIPIWGSHERNSSLNYLLPEYIYGVIDTQNPSEIVRNNCNEKEQYEVLYVDQSMTPSQQGYNL